MAYIGNTPAEAYTSIDKQTITGNGGASYTLDHAVANENEIEVFVNNVRQEPSVAYTVSGTALTMTGNVEASDDFYVVFQGKAIQTTSHPEGHDLKARDGAFSGDVTADGKLGIGTTTPSAIVSVESASNNFIRFSDSGSLTGLIGMDDGGSLASGAVDGDMVIRTQTSGKGIVFSGNGGSRFGMIDSDGLKFNGDTAAANALDDYEEGTWTAKIEGSTSNPTTDVTTTGYYTKIGRYVFCSWRFLSHSTVGAAGTVYVSGLPFSVQHAVTSGNVQTYRYNITTDGRNISPHAQTDERIRFYVSRDENVWSSVSHVAGTGRYLYGSVYYYTTE